MPSDHYDLIVIGGGSAGYAAARLAAGRLKRVVVVDGSDPLGGLCILRGCMPSKTLLYSAEVLHHARHGKVLGLEIPTAQANMAAVQKRKRRIIEDFASHRRHQLTDGPFDLIRDQVRFTGTNTIELESGGNLSADKFVVATGSRVQVPNLPGLADAPFLTSDEVLDLSTLPESTIVLGGGVIACELAQFLSRMGSRVTLVQRNPLLLKETSPEAARVVKAAFQAEGMEVFTGTKVLSVGKTQEGIEVQFEHHGQRIVRRASHLFNALGREPATDHLNLEAAGISVLRSGHIRTNAYQQTDNPAIYAAGDCAGPYELVHIAIQQGEIAARHALGESPAPIHYDHLLQIIFTDPQVGVVGPSLEELTASGKKLQEASFPFCDHGKSILMEANFGYVKVFAEEPSGRIVRAECVGREGGELLHSLATGIALGATVDQLLKAPWYHPTLSEIWTYPLEDLAEQLAG